MILEEHLKESVRKYCEMKNIPISKFGKVSRGYEREISEFVVDKMKRSIQTTRRIERENKLKIGVILKEACGGYDVLESPIEEYLYKALEGEGLDKHCKPQFEIGKKRVDFAFPIAKLVVECDGREYHHTEQWQIERDLERDKYLARKGWMVIHLEGIAIRRNINLCLDKIKRGLKPFIPGI